MTGDRWSRVLAAFAGDAAEVNGDVAGVSGAGASRRPRPSLCQVVCTVLSVSDVAVMLTSERHHGLLCSTDGLAATLDDHQFTTGEGPSIDASAGGAVVSEPSLAGDSAQTRWPVFTPAGVSAGAGAVFAYPLRVGAARLGALTLYQRAAGWLSDEQRRDAAVVADVVTLHVIAQQAAAAGSGDLAPGLLGVALHGAEVHQASGMVSARLGISVVDALILLRSRAFAEDRSVADVAGDVVHKRGHFE